MQPVQLRLGFAATQAPAALHLSLSGLRVQVEAADLPLAHAYLQDAGAEPSLDGGTLTFPAARFACVAHLPDQVALTADRNLATLLLLVTQPSAGAVPAELALEGRNGLWMRWFDGTRDLREPVPMAAAGLLLTSDLPFVATHEAFAALRESATLPLLLGKARVHHDGYVEISTSKPQMVEASALPGLFRIDETRFGMALPYHEAIDSTPGFVWEDAPPVLEHGPSVLPTLPMPLSAHVASDLRRLVDSLAAFGAQAIVWGAGLGRRVFALSAVDTLDAWPVLIVCTPATVWAWQRHLELFGRTTSLSHADADAHLVTYEELATQRPRTNPQTVVFDDIGTPGVLNDATMTAVRRLDSLTDAYRIAISSQWPSDAGSVVQVMSALRPSEFRPAAPLATRYLGDAQAKLTAHVRAYITARSADEPGKDPRQFRRSSVTQVASTDAQRKALDEALRRHATRAPAALLVEALEIASAGPSLALSPKVGVVVARAQNCLAAGRRVAVVTRHRRTASLMRAMLRTPDAVSIEASAVARDAVPKTRLAIVRYEREMPDLRWFDDVLVVDYPWSWAVLDDAVGSPTDERGPTSVMVFHLKGSIDDRLAMLAARRKEMGPVIDHTAPPTVEEMDYLLEAVAPHRR